MLTTRNHEPAARKSAAPNSAPKGESSSSPQLNPLWHQLATRGPQEERMHRFDECVRLEVRFAAEKPARQKPRKQILTFCRECTEGVSAQRNSGCVAVLLISARRKASRGRLNWRTLFSGWNFYENLIEFAAGRRPRLVHVG